MDDPQAIGDSKAFRGINFADRLTAHREFCKNEQVPTPAGGRMSFKHYYGRADFDPIIEVDDIVVAQSNAPRSSGGTDGVRLVRAMDAIHGIAQVHCACAERIGRAAAHMMGQIGPPPQHLGGRRPIRPLPLVSNGRGPAPREAIATDADAVSQSLTFAENEIEPPLAR
jgi:hypothetical protein